MLELKITILQNEYFHLFNRNRARYVNFVFIFSLPIV